VPGNFGSWYHRRCRFGMHHSHEHCCRPRYRPASAGQRAPQQCKNCSGTVGWKQQNTPISPEPNQREITTCVAKATRAIQWLNLMCWPVPWMGSYLVVLGARNCVIILPHIDIYFCVANKVKEVFRYCTTTCKCSTTGRSPAFALVVASVLLLLDC